jgi:hypothetical protein
VVVVYCVNNNRVLVARSSNQGLAYSQPVDITTMVKHPSWSHHDWSTFTGPAGGIQITQGVKAGRLLVPVEICTDPSQRGLACVGGPNSTNYALFSDDGGMSWSVSAAVPPIQPMARGKYDTPYRYSCEMNLAELPDPAAALSHVGQGGGEARLIAVRRNPEHPGLAFSSDSGESWTAPGTVEAQVVSADCKPGVARLGTAAAVISTPWSAMNVPANNLTLSVSASVDVASRTTAAAGATATWAPRVSFGGSVDYSSLCELGEGAGVGVLFEVPNKDGYMSGKLMDWDLAFQRVNASLLQP